VVIFGSCQGHALARLTVGALPRWRYQVLFYWNPAGARRRRPVAEILEALAAADYAIYQPLSEVHGELAAEPLARTVARVPEVATFPRILNDGAQSLSRANPRAPELVFGQRYVLELLEAGVDLAEVRRRFAAGEIDFEQRPRFDLALERLAQQERSRHCTLRASEFIAAEHRRRRLFLTHNHPTTALVAELAAQLRAQHGLPIDVAAIRQLAHEDPNAARLPPVPVALTPYDVAALGYEFDPDPDWREQGEALIGEIAAARGRSPTPS
jgi:Polysaccharide biosynthesis enzyme WcbI